MAARTRCRACGGSIELTQAGCTEDVVAIADEFFHRGCIEVAPSAAGPTGPAYFIPRGW